MQAVKFALVGAVNTLASLSVIFLLSGPAGADYRVANAAGFLLCYGIQFGLLTVMVSRLGWDPAPGQLAGMAAYTALSFALSRMFVYR